MKDADIKADAAIAALAARAMAREALTQNEINTLLRAVLVPAPGHVLVCCDYSQVEARALAWAAGDQGALDAFRTPGADPYAALAIRLFAIEAFDKKVHKQERDTSKKAELGCGYGMGAPKFRTTAEKGGMVWRPEAACIERQPTWGGLEPCKDPLCGVECGDGSTHGSGVIVAAWRALHAPIVRFWYALSDAAMTAAEGGRAHAGPYAFARVDRDVWAMLPSGRPIVYRNMRVGRDDQGRPRLRYLGTKGWEDTYGGKLAENVTQAFCRDLLARSLVACEAAGLRPVMHVHDEIVCEVPCTYADDALSLLECTMKDLPAWAEGFPVEAEGHVCARYRKG